MATDHLDVYFIHHFDDYTPLDETLRALDDLIHQGKVLYLASSVFAAWELAMRATRDDGLPIAVARLASVQRYGVLGYALYTSPSFLDNVTLLRRYHDLINGTGAWSMQREGDRVLVEFPSVVAKSDSK